MTDEEKLEALGPDKTPDFCVAVNFPKNTRNPQRLLNAAAAYIEALQASFHPIFERQKKPCRP